MRRLFFGVGVLLFSLTALPLSAAASLKTTLSSFLESPLILSRNLAELGSALVHFRKNAREAKTLRERLARVRESGFELEELRLENERLGRLLELKAALPPGVKRKIPSRVIARSPVLWNRVFLIDKGTRDGVRVSMLVLSERSVVGKVVETGPSVSKVMLISDPHCRIGTLIQRTRHGGVLYGLLSGECRMKYLSAEADVVRGDIVETAGFGGYFLKGLRVGVVQKVWKEAGRLYQVAQVKPDADLGRVEEVICVE